MELAERMTHTNKRVTDRYFTKLRKEFTDEEWEELSAKIAYERFRSTFNTMFNFH